MPNPYVSTQNVRCPVCSTPLRSGAANTMLCPNCFRQYRMHDDAFGRSMVRLPADRQTHENAEEKYAPAIALFIFGIIFTAAIGAIPLTILFCVLLGGTVKKQKKDGELASLFLPSAAQEKIPAAAGKKLVSRADYIRMLRALELYDMPLGSYGERAISQINRLIVKQEALITLLGSDHPFIQNANDAEAYILSNCKQIIYRLKFCDQNDPCLCRMHAEFLEKRLADNDRVLNDFENLVMEVTEFNSTTPVRQPCLDVLADTLRGIRCGDLPQEELQHVQYMQRSMRNDDLARMC